MNRERPDRPTGDGIFDYERRQQEARRHYRDIMTTPPPAPGQAYTWSGVVGFVFGEMWNRGVITMRERRLVTLACVGAADTTIPIHSHTYAALKSGDLSLEEVDEFNLQFATHLGWPKGQIMVQSTLESWGRIHAERGETAPPPRVFTWPPISNAARRGRGREMYERVMRAAPAPAASAYSESTLDFVYGDVWTRPGLSLKDRRIIAICCCGAGDNGALLEAHMRGAFDSGDVTLEEMQEIVLHFTVYLGWDRGATLDEAMWKTWNGRAR
ncbi:MAG: carboxymuconolactone decarboxylase family protein [Gammaproteobacteria bacterium]